MKALLWGAALMLLGFALGPKTRQSANHVLIITGQSEGYLSPCGCVKPMTGGIRRRNTAIKALTVKDRTTLIDTGTFVFNNDRQSEMKAEALAESLGLLKVAAVNYGLEEARLGAGMAVSLERLCGHKLLASGITDPVLPTKRFVASGPFLIGGIDHRTKEIATALATSVEPIETSIKALIEESAAMKLVPVLMTRGDLADAESLSRAQTRQRLIVFTVNS